MNDVKRYWHQRLERLQNHLQTLWETQMSASTAASAASAASIPRYRRINLNACDGTSLTIRVIEPPVSRARTSASLIPTVVYFHDMHTGPRSWLYLTRYCALGLRVMMLEQRFCPYDLVSDGGATQAQRIEDSLLTVLVALRLAHQNFADTSSQQSNLVANSDSASIKGQASDQPLLACIGEGTGAGFALAAAAILGPRVTKLAVLNPYPCDIAQAYHTRATPQIYQSLHSYLRAYDPQGQHSDDILVSLSFLDCLSFAPDVVAETLMGIGELGQEAQLSSFDALYQKLGTSHKKLVSYPRWGYERINDFEDAILQFIHFERKEHE